MCGSDKVQLKKASKNEANITTSVGNSKKISDATVEEEPEQNVKHSETEEKSDEKQTHEVNLIASAVNVKGISDATEQNHNVRFSETEEISEAKKTYEYMLSNWKLKPKAGGLWKNDMISDCVALAIFLESDNGSIEHQVVQSTGICVKVPAGASGDAGTVGQTDQSGYVILTTAHSIKVPLPDQGGITRSLRRFGRRFGRAHSRPKPGGRTSKCEHYRVRAIVVFAIAGKPKGRNGKLSSLGDN
jgi:hypothetical protein